MLRYESEHRNRVSNAGATALSGVPLQTDEEYFGGARRRLPIQLCLCVHDSPDSPCPCDGPIVWLPDDAVFSRGPSGRETVGGEELHEFRIDRDARVGVEMTLPMTAQGLSRLMTHRRMLTEWPAVTDGRAADGAEAEAIGAGVGSGPATAVLASFMAGHTIGRWLDEQTGLSSAIADGLYDALH